MFEPGFAGLTDAAVVAAVEDCARAEAVAGARRSAAIAELTRRRVHDDALARWACDWWDCAAAEVATTEHQLAQGLWADADRGRTA